MIIYRVSLPVQAWGFEFSILKRSVRTIGRRTQSNNFLKRMASYLTVRSKFSIQSYASRIDRPTEEMGVPFLPPRVKKVGREVDSCLFMQVKRREI